MKTKTWIFIPELSKPTVPQWREPIIEILYSNGVIPDRDLTKNREEELYRLTKKNIKKVTEWLDYFGFTYHLEER